MIRPTVAILIAAAVLTPQHLRAQAENLPSASPAITAQSDTERGRTLIDQMVEALGGKAWLDCTSIQIEGRGSSFFHGEPNPYVVEYHELRRLATSSQPEADRIGFLTDRGMIMPGKKIDVVQVWLDNHGYEITYKGKTDLPKDQVEDYYRRRAHSIETVVRTWLNAPGMMIVAFKSRPKLPVRVDGPKVNRLFLQRERRRFLRIVTFRNEARDSIAHAIGFGDANRRAVGRKRRKRNPEQQAGGDPQQRSRHAANLKPRWAVTEFNSRATQRGGAATKLI